jgi:hypothetical protein
MNSKNRIAKLEAANPPNQCPHSHAVVRFLKPDGSDSITDEFPKFCDCGDEIELTEVQIVPYEKPKQNET